MTNLNKESGEILRAASEHTTTRTVKKSIS